MKIVFLLYSNRSGSTFLSSRLADVTGVNVTIETTFISLLIENGKPQYVAEELDGLLEYIQKDNKLKNWNIDINEIFDSLKLKTIVDVSEIVECVLTNEFDSCNGIYIVKDPRVSMHLDEIAEYFPNSKFIYLLRDPRAVINSQLKSKSSESEKMMSTGAYLSALRWKKHYLESLKLQNNILIRLKYEDLVRDIDSELNKLYLFLNIDSGVGVSAAESNYFSKIPESQKHLHSLISGEAKESRVDAWRTEMKENDKYIIEYVLKNELLISGYDVSNDARTRYLFIIFTKVKEKAIWLYYLVKDMFLNSSRREYYKYVLRKKIIRNKYSNL